MAEEVIASESIQQRRELVNSLSSQLEHISSSADELLRSTWPAATEKRPIAATKPPIEEKPAVSLEKTLAVEPASDEHLTNYGTQQETNESTEPAKASIAAEKPGEAVAKKTSVPVSTEEKLSDYYGVSQISDAVVFVTLYPRANKVQIAGDFNNWQPEKTEMQKVGDSGIWQMKLCLPPGKHQYRLVVDGQWQQDPYNEHTESNPFGGFNSIIEVK